jgi:hypothetical protein
VGRDGRTGVNAHWYLSRPGCSPSLRRGPTVWLRDLFNHTTRREREISDHREPAVTRHDRLFVSESKPGTKPGMFHKEY